MDLKDIVAPLIERTHPANISNQFDFEFDYSICIPLDLMNLLFSATKKPLNPSEQDLILRRFKAEVLERSELYNIGEAIVNVEFCRQVSMFFIKRLTNKMKFRCLLDQNPKLFLEFYQLSHSSLQENYRSSIPATLIPKPISISSPKPKPISSFASSIQFSFFEALLESVINMTSMNIVSQILTISKNSNPTQTREELTIKVSFLHKFYLKCISQ